MEGFKTADQHKEDEENGTGTSFNEDGFIDNSYDDDEEDDMLDFHRPGQTTNHFPNTDENPEDDKNKGGNDLNLDDDDQEEENEEEEEDDEAFLEKVNARFKTNFKNKDDFKNQLKQDDIKDERQEEQSILSRNQNTIGIYENYLKQDDRNLVKMEILSSYAQEKKDINDPDIIQEVEDKIDGLEELGQLKSTANNLRALLKNQVEKLTGENKNINDKWAAKDKELAQSNKTQLQNAFAELASGGEFFGVTISPDEVKEVYKTITSGKFFEEINNSQKEIAELALMRRFKDQILKNATRPDHSDGVKKIFDQIPGANKSRSFATARGGTGNGNSSSLISDFTK